MVEHMFLMSTKIYEAITNKFNQILIKLIRLIRCLNYLHVFLYYTEQNSYFPFQFSYYQIT